MNGTISRGARLDSYGFISRTLHFWKWSGFLLLLLVLLVDASGCGPQWKKKFIRKRKDVRPPQPVLVLQSDIEATYPPEIRYREHYAYWKSWHSELIDSLGQIRKRDLRYLSGTIGELRAMLELLTGPPQVQLKEILVELSDLQARWERAPEPWNPPSAVRTRLQQLMREIDRRFHYSNVKEFLPHGTTGQTSSLTESP